jgi:hypothetical protein
MNAKILREYYYYIRGYNRAPLITVCLVLYTKDEGAPKEVKRAARGISICSPSDMPIKLEGRKIARKRAIHAALSSIGTDVFTATDPICRRESEDTMYECRLRDPVAMDLLYKEGGYKTAANVRLTEYELKNIVREGKE